MWKRLIYVVVSLVGLLLLILLGMPKFTASVIAAPDAPAAYDCTAQSDIPQAECEALVAIYDSNPGGNFGSGWLEEGIAPCSWEGVFGCAGGRVVALDLRDNQLNTVPPEIENLSNLEWLDLRDNQLTALPPEIGNLSNLFWLSLNSNQFTAVPPEIWNLTSLMELSLVNNQLTVVPSEIGNLSNLERLSFGDNQLTAVPSEIWSLSSLKGLYLQDNQLTIVPPEIGNLTSLEFLVLSGNQLTAMPPEIADLSSLTVLSLYNNSLTGPLPAALLSLNLNIFYFYNNEWCLPDETAYQTWLASIGTVIGTGRVCGQLGGSISGRVTLSDATPVNNTIVTLYRQDVLSGDEFVATTRTDSAGDYQFDDLGQGINYYVYFTPPDANAAPQYYNGQGTLNTATPVTAAPGATTMGINAVLALPQSPLATVNSSNGSVTTNPIDGTVVVAQRNGNASDITVTRTVLCADNSTPLTVTLTLANNAYPMSATGNPDEYSATIPANEVVAGTLTVVAACTAGGQRSAVGNQVAAVEDQPTTIGTVTLYDPSGQITDDQTGAPVVGATVTLYQVPDWRARTGPTDTAANTCQSNLSKDPGDPWSQPAPTDQGLPVNLDTITVNPWTAYQTTDNEGYYGWDMPDGCWYVTVGAEGYQTLTSPVVGTPTAVSDLNLSLTEATESYIYLPIVIR